MNIIKKLFINNAQHSNDELILIPSAQLYLVRSPSSPKSENECLYNEVVVSIKESTQPFSYQLVINKMTSDDPNALSDDDSDNGNDEEDLFESESNTLKSFLIMEDLKFCLFKKFDQQIITWKDMDGDLGDMFELRINQSVGIETINQFMLALYKCEFENKYKRSSLDLTLLDLKEFMFDRESIFDGNTGMLSTLSSTSNLPEYSKSLQQYSAGDSEDSEDDQFEDANDGSAALAASTGDHDSEDVKGKLLTQVNCDLYLYDPMAQSYRLQIQGCYTKILDIGNWDYWLSVSDGETDKIIIGSFIEQLEPEFSFEDLTCGFYYFTEKEALVWKLKFDDKLEFEEFNKATARSIWQQKNKREWIKVDETDQEYIIDAFSSLNVSDDMEVSDEEEELEEEDIDSKPLQQALKSRKTDDESEDEDEDEDESKSRFRGSDVNNALKIGYKDNRTYISRGNKLGIFTTDEYNDFKFYTAIENIASSKDKKHKINPTNMMMQKGDTAMIFQDKGNLNNLYKMDLEYGKVVEDWDFKKDSTDLPVVDFTANSKFGELTEDQTFLGLSKQAMFRVDPRSKNKLVDSQYKDYKTKTNFTHVATTEDGYIAAATVTGEIKLFDSVGKNAKTLIPALGDEIIGLTTSNDGRYILATCKKYLILIDAKIKSGKYKDHLGFERSFSKDSKPEPKRLRLSRAHTAFIANCYGPGKNLDFTKANFNIALNSRSKKPTSIITSIGPFAISWNLNKVLKNDLESYTISKYHQDILVGDFEFNTDNRMILTSPEDVSMVSKSAFKSANSELSIVKSAF